MEKLVAYVRCSIGFNVVYYHLIAINKVWQSALVWNYMYEYVVCVCGLKIQCVTEKSLEHHDSTKISTTNNQVTKPATMTTIRRRKDDFLEHI